MSTEYITYDNLIQANTESADFGKQLRVLVEPAQPFDASNAEGSISHMDTAMISARASKFGANCKRVTQHLMP